MNKHLQFKNNFVLKLFLLLLFVIVGMTKAKANNYSFQYGDLYYLITSESNHTVEVVCPDATYWWENETKPTGSIVIPQTAKHQTWNGQGISTTNYTVTSIGTYAFAQCYDITALTIPSTVTQIGAHAFHYCTGLGTVSIGANVTSIGQFAFNQCTSLTSATIPSSVTSMGGGCFANCSSLSSVTFNNSPTSIPSVTFYACGNLTTINIPSTVTSIGAGAFCGCSGLTSMTLNRATPPSVHIGSGTGYNASSFEGVTKSIPVHVPCDATRSYLAATGWNEFTNFQEDGTCPIDFPDGNVKTICVANWDSNGDGELSVAEAAAVTSLGTVFRGNTTITSFDELVYFTGITTIGNYAFQNCTSLTSVVIPSSVTSIGSSAFYGCSGFTGSLTIPSSVTSISNYAFYNCSGFTGSLTIPSSVTSIGSSAFYGCSGFSNVYYNATNCSDYSGNNNFPFQGCGDNLNLIIGNNVERIPAGMFRNARFSGSLTIPSSVTSIGNSAFYGCSGFTGSLTIPNTVTSIGNNAFSGCSGFTGTLTIPSSVTEIGSGAFDGCRGFTGTLTIPNTVTTIGRQAFNNCVGIAEAHINAINCNDLIFSGCTNLTSISFGESVATINPPLEYNTPNLTQITVVSGNAIYDSRNNCNAVIETSTNTLIAGIKNSTIPNTVTAIGSYAFNKCGLTSLELLSNVTTIGDYAFAGCSALTSVTLGGALNTIGSWAFNTCGLTSLELLSNVTTIGDYAFAGCNALTSVTLGGALNTIGNLAFAYCSNLTSVSIGESVTTIGHDAFTGCSNTTPTSIIMLGATPPTIVSPFYTVEIIFPFTIYVPYESIDNYKTGPGWSNQYGIMLGTEHNNIKGWVQTSINGYGDSQGSDHWRFIASPLTTSTAPTAIDDMIATTATEYDLYRFNQAGTNGEWENYKVHGFDLANGQAYLYANKSNVNLMFKGDFNENTTQNVPLTYMSGTRYAGYNLVGNPFPVNAYSSRPYYVMNSNGDAVIANAISTNEPIAPCTGVIVQAMENENNPTVTFSTSVPSTSNKGNINIALSQQVNRGNATIDRAIVSFNDGDQLGKFVLNENNAQIYLLQNGEDYAIANAETTGETPLNFKATRNGEYTLTVNPESVEMGYLHLIDNLTGNDVDLLATPSYTFSAKTDDYASRFRLVFSAANDNLDNNDDFAFISNGQLVVTGEGTLHLFDALGRQLYVKQVSALNSNLSPLTSPGVYVLRLVNGENVKTQKIVVK